MPIEKQKQGNAQQAKQVELLRLYFQVVSAGVSWKSVDIGGFPSAKPLAVCLSDGLWFEKGGR